MQLTHREDQREYRITPSRLENEMTIQELDRISTMNITPATVEAIMLKARAERAEGVRILLIELSAQLRRLAAKLRPNRQRLPQAGVWAR